MVAGASSARRGGRASPASARVRCERESGCRRDWRVRARARAESPSARVYPPRPKRPCAGRVGIAAFATLARPVAPWPTAFAAVPRPRRTFSLPSATRSFPHTAARHIAAKRSPHAREGSRSRASRPPGPARRRRRRERDFAASGSSESSSAEPQVRRRPIRRAPRPRPAAMPLRTSRWRWRRRSSAPPSRRTGRRCAPASGSRRANP